MNELVRFALTAIERTEDRLCAFIADPIQVAPKACRQAPVSRVSDDFPNLAVLNAPVEFAAELKFVSLVVNGPGAVRIH